MILLHFLGSGAPAFDLLYTVLPLAVGGFFTASVIAVQWFVGLLSDGDKSSQQVDSVSKGASR